MKYQTTITLTFTEKHLSLLIAFSYQFLLIFCATFYYTHSPSEKPRDIENKVRIIKVTMDNDSKPPIHPPPTSTAGSGQIENSLAASISNLTKMANTNRTVKSKIVDPINQKDGKDAANFLTLERNKVGALGRRDGVVKKDFNISSINSFSEVGKDNITPFQSKLVKDRLNDSIDLFQKCVDRALLADDKLLGTVDIIFQLNYGIVDEFESKLNGEGNEKSIKILYECLAKNGKVVNYPVKNIKKKFKFSINISRQ